jgi:hypothetical protein
MGLRSALAAAAAAEGAEAMRVEVEVLPPHDDDDDGTLVLSVQLALMVGARGPTQWSRPSLVGLSWRC